MSDVHEQITAEEFQAVTGVCLLLKRSDYEKIRGLDERFINGYEDVDFCFRARVVGYNFFM